MINPEQQISACSTTQDLKQASLIRNRCEGENSLSLNLSQVLRRLRMFQIECESCGVDIHTFIVTCCI